MRGIHLSLTDLDSLSAGTAASAGAGEPLELSLDSIIPDPDQPRKIFEEISIDEMAASIKANNGKVIAPISVKSANVDGLHVINYGERRWRGSIRAGCKTILAFISDTHDHVDQILENLQRADLTPLELANAIKKYVDEKDIDAPALYKRLGKDKAWYSNIMKIAGAPAEMLGMLNKCSDFTAAHRLVRAYEVNPDVTQTYVSDKEQITRTDVSAINKLINPGEDGAPPPPVHPAAGTGGGATSPAKPSGNGRGKTQPAPPPGETSDVFRRVFSMQQGGEETTKIMTTLSSAEINTANKTLSKSFKQGSTITKTDLTAVLIGSFLEGTFSLSGGEEFYRAIAFLEGVSAKTEPAKNMLEVILSIAASLHEKYSI